MEFKVKRWILIFGKLIREFIYSGFEFIYYC